MVDALLADARSNIAPDHRTSFFDVKGTASGTTLTLTGEIQDQERKDQLLRFIRERGGYAVVDSIVALPSPTLGEKTIGVVNVSVANLRTKPEHPAEMASGMKTGYANPRSSSQPERRASALPRTEPPSR